MKKLTKADLALAERLRSALAGIPRVGKGTTEITIPDKNGSVVTYALDASVVSAPTYEMQSLRVDWVRRAYGKALEASSEALGASSELPEQEVGGDTRDNVLRSRIARVRRNKGTMRSASAVAQATDRDLHEHTCRSLDQSSVTSAQRMVYCDSVCPGVSEAAGVVTRPLPHAAQSLDAQRETIIRHAQAQGVRVGKTSTRRAGKQRTALRLVARCQRAIDRTSLVLSQIIL